MINRHYLQFTSGIGCGSSCSSSGSSTEGMDRLVPAAGGSPELII